ncbi:MAG: hypothetical protein WBM44_17610 [Waterburya sp.]
MHDYLLLNVLSGSSAQDLLNGHAAGIQTLRGSIDQMWSTYIGAGQIWQTICKFASIIAFVCLAWLLVNMVKKVTSDGDILDEMDKFVLIIAVCILLFDNGYMDAIWAKGMRGLVVGINDTVATQLKTTNAIKEEFEELLGRATANQALAAAEEQCSDIFDENIDFYEACMKSQLKQWQEASKSEGFKGAIQGILNSFETAGRKASKGLGYIGTTALLSGQRFNLYRTGIAFAVSADLAMLITGLFGPIAAAASLMPVGSKAIFAWITGYYMIGSTQIAYTLMIGLAADMLSDADALGDLILPFLIGRSLPIIAIGLGVGGGAALFSSLSASSLSSIGKSNWIKSAVTSFKK